MDIVDKLEKVAGAIKLIEEFMDKTNVKQSPKMKRLFRGIQSVEKARLALKQAQQVQELMQAGGKSRNIAGNLPADNLIPVLLLLLNNLSVPEAPEAPE